MSAGVLAHSLSGHVLIGLCLMALAGVSLSCGTGPAQKKAEGQPQTAIRTVRAQEGPLEQTIRVTGVTAAERSVILRAPRLRGSRGGGGLTTNIGSRSSRTASLSGTYMTSGGGGSSSSAPSSSSSSSAPSSSSSASTGGRGASSNPALSRLGATRSTTTSSSSSRATSTSTSTASFSISTSGGGRGADDFTLTLQKQAAAGTRVNKGDVVAEFDRENMLTRLDDYRAAMEQVEAGMRIFRSDLEVDRNAQALQIASAKADLEKAQLDLKVIPVLSAIDSEWRKLYAEEVEARYKQMLADRKLNELSQKSQERIAELEEAQAKIELQRAEANADRLIVRSPIPGLVVMESVFRGGEFVQIDQGDTVTPGQSYLRIVDLSSMVVDAVVNQVDVDQIRIGAKARVHFDAFPGLELPATVYSIGMMPSASNARPEFVKQIAIRLRVDGTDPRVIPDLSVSADIVVDREDKTVIAPRESLFGMDTGKPFVFVQAQGGWQRREVELGMVSNLAAAVRSGLRPGDILAAETPRTTAGNQPADRK